MTTILGISAFYHDSAAALVVDGRIVAAAQEERFTRKKHDHRFPTNAIEYCLASAEITPGDIDYVAFYDKPFLKFERLLETYVSYAPRGFKSFVRAMPLWMKQKLHLPRLIREGLGGKLKNRVVFPEHHESHAASAFFPSPFEEAAILTLDGVGEWATTSFGMGRGNKIELTHQLRFPHSIGLLYSAFTYFTGFRVNSGEYKLMGLAPYGRPTYADRIRENLLDIKDDGSFRMDMTYFDYCHGLRMTNDKFAGLFDGPRREPESPITQREMDIAASIQVVTEELVMKSARHVHEVTGAKNLCLAGGVALNCVANGKLLRDGPFDELWIQPAAGDAGGALGAALLVWHQLLGNAREVGATDSQRGSFLGPCFSADEIRRFLEGTGAVFHELPDASSVYDRAADLLAESKVVGWMQGRAEFGPRALGGRSILGDPRSEKMQRTMNLKIKFRESFRPFAPSVLRDRAAKFFELDPDDESPYMLLVAPVAESQRIDAKEEVDHLVGLEKLNARRSEIPAITHVDYSARVQTVDAERNPAYHALLRAFEARTGCGVLVNTSFNVRGEPIVNTPADAYNCFLGTNMDVLVMERFLLLREEQSGLGSVTQEESHAMQFALD